MRVEIGEQSGLTNADGTWRASVAPGDKRLAVYQHALALAFLPVRVHPGEVAQYIITLTGEDRRAMVSIESSHADGREPRPQAGQEVTAAEGLGALVGRVVSTEDGAAIAGARIFVSGTPVEARTDEEGRFNVEVPVGEYAVSVLHSEFATRTVDGVRIERDGETQRNFELPPAGLELAEYVVVEPYIEGSLTAVVASRRESASVTDVLSAEQISRAGDSDAAGALKRVTGLTLVDGQYIYVRGLGERYSSVLLNGASIPSPDPTRRVVPLDLFPTDIIRDVIVQKTATASMPGQFGGGTVQLRTLGFPESFVGKLSVSGGYNSEATGAEGLTYDGGGRDWTGRDDGTRALPTELAEATADGQFLNPRSLSNPDGITQEEFEVLGEALAESSAYDVQRRSVRPDFGLSGALGNSYEVNEWLQLGALGAFRYSNSWDYREEERAVFRASDAGLELRDSDTVERTLHNIDFSAFTNLSAKLGSHSEIGLTGMLLRQTEDEVSISEGLEDTQLRRRFRLQWEENELQSLQALGEHTLFGIEGLELDWQLTDATASREEPNTRLYRRDDDDSDGEFIYSTRADSNSQTFGELVDNVDEYGVDLQLPIRFIPFETTLTSGITGLERDRDAEIRTFSFSGRVGSDLAGEEQSDILSPDNIGPGGIQLRETTQRTDNYTALQTLDSRYVALDIQPVDWLRLNAGLRWEDNFQEVTTADLSNPQAPPVVADIDENDRLKSAALTWQYSDSAQIRAGYAETLSRPDFRELSPAPFLDPVLDLVTVGNPDLRVTRIKNYDLRWEYYFNQTDSLSIAAFSKDFVDPIEKTFSSGGSAKFINLRNALSATVEGWEVDLYRNLELVGEQAWLDRVRMGWLRNLLSWENYYIAANYSDIESTVELDPAVTAQTNVSRPLQGQSPYVLNFQIGYSTGTGDWEWTLLFNQFGERIVQAGVSRQPDIYEEPFAQLDFVYKQRFMEHWAFKAKLSNLLDPDVEFTQGEEVVRRYTKGRGVSVGLELAF